MGCVLCRGRRVHLEDRVRCVPCTACVCRSPTNHGRKPTFAPYYIVCAVTLRSVLCTRGYYRTRRPEAAAATSIEAGVWQSRSHGAAYPQGTQPSSGCGCCQALCLFTRRVVARHCPQDVDEDKLFACIASIRVTQKQFDALLSKRNPLASISRPSSRRWSIPGSGLASRMAASFGWGST